MSKVVCPYCFQEFDSKDVEFRCGNFGRCKQVDDPDLHRFWGMPQITGVPIKPSHGFLGLKLGTPKYGVCPECGEKSYLMICPNCHNRVPREMVKKKGFIISIIGARSSGKTVYITTLINELFRHGHDLDIGITAVNIADDPRNNTQQHYEEDFFKPIYRDLRCPPATQKGDIRSKIPLIYELNQGSENSLYLVFYDTAGENFNDPKEIAANVRYLDKSDAIIYLLDTFAINDVHRRLGIGTPVELAYNAIFANVLSHFRANVSEEVKGNHFKKPMAFVFTKIDAVLDNEDAFADAKPTNMSMEANSSYLGGEGINLSEFGSIDDGLKATLNAWGESNFLGLLKFYKNAKCFGVSALGGSPDASNNIKRVRPYRVLDPLVWILSQFKFPLPLIK